MVTVEEDVLERVTGMVTWVIFSFWLEEVSLKVIEGKAPLLKKTKALPEFVSELLSSLEAPTMTSLVPSPLKSPAAIDFFFNAPLLIKEPPNSSPALCPFKITSASASAVLVPVIPPKNINALPDLFKELLSSSLAPTITSSLPSPLKSPADATVSSQPNVYRLS